MTAGGPPSISVVMPAHNEQDMLAESVGTVLTGLAKLTRVYEVIVCENGSTDGTRSLAARLSEEHPEVRVLSLAEADYGSALREGFLAARCELVANFDVDLVDFDFLQLALDRMGYGDGSRSDAADGPALSGAGGSGAGGYGVAIVVGTKRGPGSEDKRSAGRRAVTAVFSLVLRGGFGLRVSDTHGLKLQRREALLAQVGLCRFGGDIFDTELVIRAARNGAKVEEVPVRVADRRPPRTPIAKRIPRSLVGLARLRARLWSEQMSGRPGRR